MTKAKEIIEKIGLLGSKPQNAKSKLVLISLIMELQAELQDDQPVPDDVLLKMDQDIRKIALSGLCLVILMALQEEK
jgi:hypothetical protein